MCRVFTATFQVKGGERSVKTLITQNNNVAVNKNLDFPHKKNKLSPQYSGSIFCLLHFSEHTRTHTELVLPGNQHLIHSWSLAAGNTHTASSSSPALLSATLLSLTNLQQECRKLGIERTLSTHTHT